MFKSYFFRYFLRALTAAFVSTATPVMAQGDLLTPVLEGFIQSDARIFPADETARYTNDLSVRRVRVGVSGFINSAVSFRIVPDFAGSRISVTDAFIELKVRDALKLRVGKFKAPLSIERAQGITHNAFAEQGATLLIAPNYDVGGQLFGDVAGGIVSYAIGVFDGVADGQSVDGDSDDSKDVNGRVQITPFLRRKPFPFARLTVGGGWTHGSRLGTLAAPEVATYRTSGQGTFYSYHSNVMGSGVHRRVAAYVTNYTGPVGFLAEWIRSSQSITRAPSESTPTVGDVLVHHRASQIYATVVLTGEAASFRGVNPAKPFDPSRRQWGAVELTGRLDEFLGDEGLPVRTWLIDTTRSATRARSRTTGINWYLTTKLRATVNYQYTTFRRGAANGANRPVERAVLARLQTIF